MSCGKTTNRKKTVHFDKGKAQNVLTWDTLTRHCRVTFDDVLLSDALLFPLMLGYDWQCYVCCPRFALLFSCRHPPTPTKTLISRFQSL